MGLEKGNVMAGTVTAEREMWIAVLWVAFKDAERGDERSLTWFEREGRDMRQVCALAGFDPVAVAERVRKMGLGRSDQHVAPARANGFDLPDPLSAKLLQRLAGLRQLVGGLANA